MATQQQMSRFYRGSVRSSSSTAAGNFFRLGTTNFMPWSDQEVAIGVINGVEYVDTREAKSGTGKSYYTDSVSSCCALAATRVAFGPPRESGALRQVLFVKTFLSHVVDSSDADMVKAELLRFQPALNAAIKFYMFTMQTHLDTGRLLGGQGVGFAGAVGGLLGAYGTGALDQIAAQTTIVTGYQGVDWNNSDCGVYVRPHGVYPVTSQVAPQTPQNQY